MGKKIFSTGIRYSQSDREILAQLPLKHQRVYLIGMHMLKLSLHTPHCAACPYLDIPVEATAPRPLLAESTQSPIAHCCPSCPIKIGLDAAPGPAAGSYNIRLPKKKHALKGSRKKALG
jgi:hypothetical protein